MKKLFCLFLLCTLGLAACAVSRGGQYLARGEYDRAAFEYAHELRQNPGNGRIAVLQGYAYYKGGKYQAAYEALMPQTENYRMAGYAAFWAGLAALKMEDGVKLTEAWSRWQKDDARDYESMMVFRGYQSILSNRDLSGLAYLADQIEFDMNGAYAKDEYVRKRLNSRGSSIMGESYYGSFITLRPLPYLP